jgi:large subunit ribosomal protein L17
LVKKLFSELAPSITELSGGYTRIYRLGNRAGDGAQIAVLELLVQPKRKERRRRRSKSKA